MNTKTRAATHLQIGALFLVALVVTVVGVAMHGSHTGPDGQPNVIPSPMASGNPLFIIAGYQITGDREPDNVSIPYVVGVLGPGVRPNNAVSEVRPGYIEHWKVWVVTKGPFSRQPAVQVTIDTRQPHRLVFCRIEFGEKVISKSQPYSNERATCEAEAASH